MTESKRRIIYAKCDGRCAYCGRKVRFEKFEVDHILLQAKMLTYRG